MNPILNILINIFLVLLSMLHFTCEKQKKSSIFIVFLSFSSLGILNNLTGTTAYIFKVFQLIFLFCIGLVCYKQNYKNVITGIFFCLAIQSLSVNIPYILRFYVEQKSFMNDDIYFIGSSPEIWAIKRDGSLWAWGSLQATGFDPVIPHIKDESANELSWGVYTFDLKDNGSLYLFGDTEKIMDDVVQIIG